MSCIRCWKGHRAGLFASAVVQMALCARPPPFPAVQLDLQSVSRLCALPPGVSGMASSESAAPGRPLLSARGSGQSWCGGSAHILPSLGLRTCLQDHVSGLFSLPSLLLLLAPVLLPGFGFLPQGSSEALPWGLRPLGPARNPFVLAIRPGVAPFPPAQVFVLAW